MTELMEVVLDLGRPPLARFPASACLGWWESFSREGRRGERGMMEMEVVLDVGRLGSPHVCV